MSLKLKDLIGSIVVSLVSFRYITTFKPSFHFISTISTRLIKRSYKVLLFLRGKIFTRSHICNRVVSVSICVCFSLDVHQCNPQKCLFSSSQITQYFILYIKGGFIMLYWLCSHRMHQRTLTTNVRMAVLQNINKIKLLISNQYIPSIFTIYPFPL